MKISKEAIEKITKPFEGLRLVAYCDEIGRNKPYTIGWGHTRGVKKGDRITLEQAEAFLLEDLAVAEAVVNKFVIKPLTQNQFDALVDFVFNLGETKFRGSTLMGYLNSGQFSKAAGEFNKWKYAGGKVQRGLVLRRQACTDLFNKKD